MNGTTVFGAVDLDTAAVGLARRLASLRRFLDAAHELLTISHFTFSQFKRYSRQVCAFLSYDACATSTIPISDAHRQIITLMEVKLSHHFPPCLVFDRCGSTD
jgi:hypothetical protein